MILLKKKLLLIFLVLVILLFIWDFSKEKPEKDYKDEEIRSVFISYIELKNHLQGKVAKDAENEIQKMISNLKRAKMNTIFLQVRSFSDAIYKSDLFPWSSSISLQEGEDPGYDPLELFIKYTKKEEIALYAWINPYRVRTGKDLATITETNPAFSYINTDTLYVGEGIFYNPSKKEVEDLIVEGVVEILENYEVDGIIFDDYFYPAKDIDLNDYQSYLEKNSYVTIEDYHLKVVNNLVKRVYDTCHKYHKKFGISPDGNIENNYQKNFADVYKWTKEVGYIDFIIPQIYYGFYNETKPFYEVSHTWNDMIKNNEVSLLIALAFYKVGEKDSYAKNGENEWVLENDMIKRQIVLSRNLSFYKGFSLFRYDYLFSSELQKEATLKEIKNMEEILK